jgi:hypothetical protein
LFFDLFVAMCNHMDDIEQLNVKGTPRTIWVALHEAWRRTLSQYYLEMWMDLDTDWITWFIVIANIHGQDTSFAAQTKLIPPRVSCWLKQQSSGRFSLEFRHHSTDFFFNSRHGQFGCKTFWWCVFTTFPPLLYRFDFTLY